VKLFHSSVFKNVFCPTYVSPKLLSKVNIRTQGFLFVEFHFPFKSTKKYSHKSDFTFYNFLWAILNLYLSVTVLIYKLLYFLLAS